MQQDYVAISFPSFRVDELEDGARQLLDAVELLWNAGRLRGLVSSDVGQLAFRGFLNGVADAMAQMLEAEREGRSETALTVRLSKTSARDIVAFASTISKLASDEATMSSVGGASFTPATRALIEVFVRHARTAMDELVN